MIKKNYIWSLVVAIFFLAIIGLVYNVYKSFYMPELYLTASQLKDKKSKSSGIVKVIGSVKEGTIIYDNKKMILTFDAYDRYNPREVIHVIYKGFKPDLLEADRDVAIEGKYDQDKNIFDASILMVGR